MYKAGLKQKLFGNFFAKNIPSKKSSIEVTTATMQWWRFWCVVKNSQAQRGSFSATEALNYNPHAIWNGVALRRSSAKNLTGDLPSDRAVNPPFPVKIYSQKIYCKLIINVKPISNFKVQARPNSMARARILIFPPISLNEIPNDQKLITNKNYLVSVSFYSQNIFVL